MNLSKAILTVYEEMHKAEKKDLPPAKGVGSTYKNMASKSANVMWRAKIKGQTHLDNDIPLHMSLKTFHDPSKLPADEIHNKVKEFNIQRPDPSKLKYHANTFKSPKTGENYYMLHVHGTDPSYKKFNDHFRGQGITHDKFMTHVTINKDLYDRIKKEGLHPHEVEFSPLMIEHGVNNPTHLFEDKQSHNDHKSDVTPKKINPIKKSENIEKELPELMKPYRSEAQRRWAHTAEGTEALGGKAHVHEWDEATKGKHLPEKLEKGALKNIGAGLAIAGSLASSTPHNTNQNMLAPKAPTAAMAQAPKSPYSSQRMLRTIASVESSGGKNVAHAPVAGKMHHGESGYGKYALMPETIRETIGSNKDLKSKYGKATKLQGQDIHNFMRDNKGLEDVIAQRHLSRLEHHFGQNPENLGFAWNQGVTGTNRALKNKFDIKNHAYVKKFLDAYGKEK